MQTYLFRVIYTNKDITSLGEIPTAIIINDSNDFKIIPISLVNEVVDVGISTIKLANLTLIVSNEITRHLASLKDLEHFNILDQNARKYLHMSGLMHVNCNSTEEAGDIIYEKIKI